MKQFDLIVVGSGAGTHVASVASKEGLKVALVDQGPAGGVCLNNGYVPSKMLIYPADVIRILQRTRYVGVDACINKIDFKKIMRRMHLVIENNRRHLEKEVKTKKNITFLNDSAEFIGNYSLQAGNNALTAQKIVIVSAGARAFVPPIQGLKEAGYLDNVNQS
jgi:mycothione reductase